MSNTITAEEFRRMMGKKEPVSKNERKTLNWSGNTNQTELCANV